MLSSTVRWLARRLMRLPENTTMVIEEHPACTIAVLPRSPDQSVIVSARAVMSEKMLLRLS